MKIEKQLTVTSFSEVGIQQGVFSKTINIQKMAETMQRNKNSLERAAALLDKIKNRYYSKFNYIFIVLQ